MSDRFVDDVLAGSALWTDIDDYVAEWHEGGSDEPLHEFLGLTKDEYALWVEKPEALRLILAAREYKEPLNELLVEADEFALAARGLSQGDVRTVRSWLQRTGRLPNR